jgi:hypothetical protein
VLQVHLRQVRKELKDQVEDKVLKEHKDHKEHKDQKEVKELKVQQEHHL